jgi:hypothetical protein
MAHGRCCIVQNRGASAEACDACAMMTTVRSEFIACVVCTGKTAQQTGFCLAGWMQEDLPSSSRRAALVRVLLARMDHETYTAQGDRTNKILHTPRSEERAPVMVP